MWVDIPRLDGLMDMIRDTVFIVFAICKPWLRDQCCSERHLISNSMAHYCRSCLFLTPLTLLSGDLWCGNRAKLYYGNDKSLHQPGRMLVSFGIIVVSYLSTLFVASWYIYASVEQHLDNGLSTICHLTVIHYGDIIMSAMASQIANVSIVCRIVCSDAEQRKHGSSASLAF